MVAAMIAFEFAGTPTTAILPTKILRGRLFGMKGFLGVVRVIQNRRNGLAKQSFDLS